MILTIAGFEFRQRLRRFSTYVYFLVFCALGYLFTLMSGGAVPGASVDFGTGGKVLVNSPFALDLIISYVTFFGVVVTAALLGRQPIRMWTITQRTSFLPHRSANLIISEAGFSASLLFKS